MFKGFHDVLQVFQNVLLSFTNVLLCSGSRKTIGNHRRDWRYHCKNDPILNSILNGVWNSSAPARQFLNRAPPTYKSYTPSILRSSQVHVCLAQQHRLIEEGGVVNHSSPPWGIKSPLGPWPTNTHIFLKSLSISFGKFVHIRNKHQHTPHFHVVS